jgi:hypothetical protein
MSGGPTNSGTTNTNATKDNTSANQANTSTSRLTGASQSGTAGAMQSEEQRRDLAGLASNLSQQDNTDLMLIMGESSRGRRGKCMYYDRRASPILTMNPEVRAPSEPCRQRHV